MGILSRTKTRRHEGRQFFGKAIFFFAASRLRVRFFSVKFSLVGTVVAVAVAPAATTFLSSTRADMHTSGG